MEEPPVKRAVAFFDGQNLYHHAKAAFGYHYPNYNPVKLFDAVCALSGWKPFGVRFYTGTPPAAKDAKWHGFWAAKLLALRRAEVVVQSRELRYYPIKITDPGGASRVVETPHEKGIDVRLALDVVRLALTKQLDVAVIFSQDGDLGEVVDEIREIARVQDRWIKVACAYPSGPRASASQGIDKTDWIKIDRQLYDSCLDPFDYRPAAFRNPASPFG